MEKKSEKAVRAWRNAKDKAAQPIDPLGSYTGVPTDEMDQPEQDADDL